MSSASQDTLEYSPSPPVVSSNFNSPLQPSAILPNALPEPTYIPPDPTKKSHARKQPRGHVPRPRNAFILFRCDFVRQKKVPEDVENDHRNISRIAGRIWREMSDIEKSPWIEMAEKEKTLHHQAYPGYRYAPSNSQTPLQSAGRKKKRGDCDTKPVSNIQDIDVPRRRSSSCPPPGAKPIPFGHAQHAALSQDDSVARRPSRVVMYHSTPSGPDSEVTGSTLPHDTTVTFPWPKGPMGPPLTTGPYNLALPVDAPGWDSAPPQPKEWSEWGDFNTYPSLELGNDIYSAGLFDFDVTNTIPIPLFTDPFTLSAPASLAADSFSTTLLSPLDPPKSCSDFSFGGVYPFNGDSNFLRSTHDLSANPMGPAPQIYQGGVDISNVFPRLSLEDIPNISRLGQMSKHSRPDHKGTL